MIFRTEFYSEDLARTEQTVAPNMLSMVIICVGKIALVTSLELDHVLDKLSSIITRPTYECDCYYNYHVGRAVFTEAGGGQKINLNIGHYSTDKERERHQRLGIYYFV
jgi:hypothetical protein